MNEQDDELIFSVELNEGDLEKRANVCRASIAQLRQERSQLDKDLKAGKVDAQAYGTALGVIEKASKSAKTELAQITRTLDTQDKANKAAAGSIDQLRANLTLMTTERIKLSAADRDGTEAGQALTQRIAETTQTVKGLEKATGDYRREVGSYSLAVKTAMKDMGLLSDEMQASKTSITALGEELDHLKKKYSGLNEAQRNGAEGKGLLQQIQNLNTTVAQQSEGLSKSRKGIRDYINDLTIMGVNVGEVREKFAGGSGGVKAFASSVLTTRGALIALTAVPVVLLLTALYAVLTKTQGGLDFVERKTAAVVKVFQFLTTGAANVGQALISAFENPKQALLDLGNFIGTNLTNRLNAFLVIAQAAANFDFKGMTNGVIQLSTGIENGVDKVRTFGQGISDAAKAGDALAKTTIKLRGEESKLAADRAKSKADIERLNKLGDDTTKNIKVRTDAYRQAYAMEDTFNQRALQLQQRRINAVKAEYKGREGLEEAQKAINEENTKYYELEEASLTKRTELQNSVNGAVKEGADASKAAADAAKQAAQEQAQLAVQLAEKRLQIAVLRGQDTLAFETELLRKQAAAEALQYAKNSKVRQLIEEETDLKVAALRIQKAAETAQRFAQIETMTLEARLALVKSGTLDEFNLQLSLIRQKAEAERQAVNASKATEKEKQAQLVLINANALRAQLDAISQYQTARLQKEQEEAQKSLDIQQHLNDRLREDRAKALIEQQADIEAKLALLKEGSADELTLTKALINNKRQQQLNAAQLTASMVKAINDKADKEEEEAEEKKRQKRLDKIRGEVERISGIYSQVVQSYSQVFEAQVQSQLKALDKQQQAALDNAALSAEQRTAIEKQYQKKKEALELEAAKKRKKIASVQNLINTALAITAALTTVGFDPVTKAIAVALAVATGAAQQAAIESQTFTAATGGVFQSDGRGAIVRGAGTGTSDSINARLSNGEAVINAKSTKEFYGILSMINQYGGGRPYPGTAGMVQLAAPGLLSSYAQGGVNAGQPIDYDKLADKIGQRVGEANRLLPAPITDVQAVTRVQQQEQSLRDQNNH